MGTGTTFFPILLAATDYRPQLLINGLYLAGALLLGALVIDQVRRWWQRSHSESLTPGDQLAEYRALRDQGTISQEEYERLRGLLGGQIRRAVVGERGPAGGDSVTPAPAAPKPESGGGDSAPPDQPPATGIQPG